MNKSIFIDDNNFFKSYELTEEGFLLKSRYKYYKREPDGKGNYKYFYSKQEHDSYIKKTGEETKDKIRSLQKLNFMNKIKKFHESVLKENIHTFKKGDKITYSVRTYADGSKDYKIADKENFKIIHIHISKNDKDII